jgi:hypothetical protein
MPIYPVLVSEDCDGNAVDFVIHTASGDVTPAQTNFFYDDGADVYLALVEDLVDTTPFAGQTLTFDATVTGGDPVSTSDTLDIINVCSINDPNACDESTLDPSDPTMVGPPFPDTDCDGVPDCVDFSLGGGGDVEYYGEADQCTAAAWSCPDDMWSECTDVEGYGYGQFRYVRDCNNYPAPCCTLDSGVASSYKACPPPAGFKACIEEEAFPVFTWSNVLMIILLLSGFYGLRKKH